MIRRLAALICAILSMLFGGCASPRAADLNASHDTVTFEVRKTWERSWAVDRASFVDAHAIVIYPYGADDPSRQVKDRMRGDFYSVFEENSLALMASIFGASRGDVAPENAEYLLDVKIMDVHSKGTVFTTQKSVFEIEIGFKIIRVGQPSEEPLAETAARGRCASVSGTTFSFHSNAHKRANNAINSAFLNAQQKLYMQVSERLE